MRSMREGGGVFGEALTRELGQSIRILGDSLEVFSWLEPLQLVKQGVHLLSVDEPRAPV